MDHKKYKTTNDIKGKGSNDVFLCFYLTEEINNEEGDWKLATVDLDVAYSLWKLCGITAEAILTKNNNIKQQFPIMTVPMLAFHLC